MPPVAPNARQGQPAGLANGSGRFFISLTGQVRRAAPQPPLEAEFQRNGIGAEAC